MYHFVVVTGMESIHRLQASKMTHFMISVYKVLSYEPRSRNLQLTKTTCMRATIAYNERKGDQSVGWLVPFATPWLATQASTLSSPAHKKGEMDVTHTHRHTNFLALDSIQYTSGHGEMQNRLLSILIHRTPWCETI